MAQRTVTVHYSDLSGAEIDEKGVGVRFELDGSGYEIDLAEHEVDALRAALAPFVAVSRQVRNHPPTHRTRGSISTDHRDEPTAGTLRQWARENGFDVPARGRVPELVREAYKAANSY